MDCRKVRELILLNSDSALEKSGSHLENCSSCREFYESVRLINNGESLFREGPSGLEERCLEKIKQERIVKSGAEKKGITVQMRYLAAAAVLIIVLSVSITLSIVSFTSEGSIVVYLSLYAPDAEFVSVVGDWNDWIPDSDVLQDKDRDGRWEIKLEVLPGKEYRYQFLINGEIRLADPDSRFTVDDGFGGENSILDI